MIKSHQQFELFGKKTFVKVTVKPPFQFVAEMPHEACFYYIVEGEASIYMPEKKLTTAAGEGLLMECGVYVNEYPETKDTKECEAIGVHLYPEVLKMIYEKEIPNLLAETSKVKPIKFEQYKASALLKNYIDSLQFYFENTELVSDELLKIKLKELLLLLVKTGHAESVKNLLNSVFGKTEIDFKTVITANLFNNLSLQELAAICQLSISSFKRTFARHYDEAPARYIKRKKLERATKLLQATSLRITDIAYECGFQDSAHFSKSFKSEFNSSPKAFREAQEVKG